MREIILKREEKKNNTKKGSTWSGKKKVTEKEGEELWEMKKSDFNRAIIYGFGNDFVRPFVGPNKKSTYNFHRKCLIFKSPLSGSNQRPTDYKSYFNLILTRINLFKFNL